MRNTTDAETAATEAPAKKRKNTSAKGAVVERIAIGILEADGYLVHRCVRTGAKRGPFWVSISNDIFGCIDLVAKKLGAPTLWVQVTADSGIGRKADEMLQVPWDLAFDTVEIWKWTGGGRRNHKVTGVPLDHQFFTVHRLIGSQSEGGKIAFSAVGRIRPAAKAAASQVGDQEKI